MSLNDDTPSFPWFTTEFLKKITATKYSVPKDIFKIKSFSTSYAAAKGDNYLGTVFRVKVDVHFIDPDKCVTDYYVIKTNYGEVVSGSNAMSDEFQAYQIEIETYKVILPALEKLFEDVGEEVRFGPRCYGVFCEPVDIIVLEDLKQEGFQMFDRHSVFDMTQVSKILQLLAKFHAASAVYVTKNGPLNPVFNRGMFSDKFIGKRWGVHYDHLYKTFKNLMNEWTEFKTIANKIENKFGDKIYEKCCHAMECHPNDFNVLNHGDTWITNILFTEHLDLRLLDFQFASWGSPTQDLWFLISTSIGIGDRIKNFDSIIDEYHIHLKISLESLKYVGNIPTREDLYQDMIKRGVLALGMTVESFAAISIDKGMQIDFELTARDDEKGEEFRRKIFCNSRFINTAKEYLIFLDDKGIFE